MNVERITLRPSFNSLLEAEILFSPIPPQVDNSFSINSKRIHLGQIDLISRKRNDLLKLLDDAIEGAISTDEGKITLPKENNFGYHTESYRRDLWYYQLHLSITGRINKIHTYSELSEIDNALRLSQPPFDGLHDAANWLGLRNTDLQDTNPRIDVRINPPIDIIIPESSLKNGKFELILHAHPEFNVELTNLAIGSFPGDNLKTRRQIASEITWGEIRDNRRIGHASITTQNTDSLLAMLMIGNSTVRRQWFLDPEKARNNRLLSVQSYDNDLRMIKKAVLESPDSHRFETGVSALLFLLGFSPCIQIETDSPDLIAQTPSGRLILIECTLRIADVATKTGKLVDRRGFLEKELQKSGHFISIASVLVCRLPRDQIAAHTDDLVSHGIILVTQDKLRDAFNQVRYHNDPDKILDEAESSLREDSQIQLDLS